MDGSNDTLSPIVHGDIVPSINTQCNTERKVGELKTSLLNIDYKSIKTKENTQEKEYEQLIIK